MYIHESGSGQVIQIKFGLLRFIGETKNLPDRKQHDYKTHIIYNKVRENHKQTCVMNNKIIGRIQ